MLGKEREEKNHNLIKLHGTVVIRVYCARGLLGRLCRGGRAGRRSGRLKLAREELIDGRFHRVDLGEHGLERGDVCACQAAGGDTLSVAAGHHGKDGRTGFGLDRVGSAEISAMVVDEKDNRE